MAKLQRKTQKIFSSSAATNEHAVFGTMKNIVNNEQPQYSMDIEVLQDSTAFLLGWQNAVVAGFAPFLEEMNGIFYVITSQLAYLLNNGVAEYDTNTTYYQGDIIKVINDGVPTLKYSVIDNNTGNDTDDTNYWADLVSNADIAIATTETPGIVQPDGTTITITNEGIISAAGANTNLSNLTDNGKAKFQYAPFSVNNGTTDNSGNNATLQTVGNVPVSVDKYVVPVMSSNTAEGVTVVRGGCAGGTAPGNWAITQPRTYLMASAYGESRTVNWTFTFTSENYIPVGAICTFTLSATDARNAFVQFNYSDNTSEIIWQSSLYTTTTQTVTASKEVISVFVQGTGNQASSAQTLCELHMGNFTLRAQYTVSSADTLICNPCTITTADSRTKTFTADNLLDCSSTADGTYKVMKSYTDGSLNLIPNFTTSKTDPGGKTLWTQPVLSADGTLGGDSFAVAYGSIYDRAGAYLAFDNNTATSWQGGRSQAANQSVNYLTIYNPQPLQITSFAITNHVANEFSATNGKIEVSDDGTNFTELTSFTNGNYTEGGTWNINLDNSSYYKYYRIYFWNSGSSLQIQIAEVKITAYISANPDTNTFWLDISQYPLQLKQFNGTNWIVNNNLVCIGDVTVSSGVITKVVNNPFNWNGVTGSSAAMPSDRYIDLTLGASGTTYTAPADGWIFLNKSASQTNSGYLGLTTSIGEQIKYGNNGVWLTMYAPVKKGDYVIVNYTISGDTNIFRFYYSQS